MTNGELYEIAGRAAALRGYIKSKRKQYAAIGLGEPSLSVEDIEALMGWNECCRKCGHPANEEDILNDEREAG